MNLHEPAATKFVLIRGKRPPQPFLLPCLTAPQLIRAHCCLSVVKLAIQVAVSTPDSRRTLNPILAADSPHSTSGFLPLVFTGFRWQGTGRGVYSRDQPQWRAMQGRIVKRVLDVVVA